ncbi:MAG: RraA family protein [Acetobacterales bacterium]
MAKKAKSGKKERTAAERAIRALKGLPSGFVTDAMLRLGIGGWMAGLHPANGKAVVGVARTLRYAPRGGGGGPSDRNIYEVMAACGPGEILVIETGGTDCYVSGENMASHAQACGLAATVVDACVRDFREIAGLKMPVYCRGASIRPNQLEVVGYDVEVCCAGANVKPGDIVVGDGDGIAVIPQARIDDVLYQVEDVAALEAEQERLITGKRPITELNALLKKKKALRK